MNSSSSAVHRKAQRESDAHNELSLSSTVRVGIPDVPFLAIKRAILGKQYELSVVCIGDARARALNERYRNKRTPANVLSFPLTESSGEIYLNLARARREAHRFGFTPHGHIVHLFIHGCVHLKGHDHGSTMERIERRLWRTFHVR